MLTRLWITIQLVKRSLQSQQNFVFLSVVIRRIQDILNVNPLVVHYAVIKIVNSTIPTLVQLL